MYQKLKHVWMESLHISSETTFAVDKPPQKKKCWNDTF